MKSISEVRGDTAPHAAAGENDPAWLTTNSLLFLGNKIGAIENLGVTQVSSFTAAE
jgi:hypothetical protein